MAVLKIPAAVIRWLSRRTGLYRIDIWLWARRARQLDELADTCAQQGLADAARQLRGAARAHRLAITEWTR